MKKRHRIKAERRLISEIPPEALEPIPAIPPDDYTGSQADWMCGLLELGVWDGEGWHGDVLIPVRLYVLLLEMCET